MIDLNEGKHFLKNLAITGCIAGSCKTVFAPIDRIKLILQSQENNILILKGHRKRYNGILDLLRRVPEEQGIFSFWRGNFTNVIRYIPVQAFNFAYYDFYKRMLRDNDVFASYVTSGNVHTAQLFVAGALAAITSFSLTYPLEFCQTRLAVDIGCDKCDGNNLARTPHREFRSLRHCIIKVSAISGPQGIYKGFPVALLGATVYRSTYFAFFDICKRTYAKYHSMKERAKMSLLTKFFTAHSVTATAGFIAYPIDTVGRRIMMDSGRLKQDRKYLNAIDCAKKIMRQEGIMAFYKGGLTNVVRSYSGACVLVIYDEVRDRTNWIQKNTD